MSVLDHIDGQTFHGRRGGVENAFRYSIDYVLIDPEADPKRPALFGRNRRNLAALYDKDHGGAPGKGAGADWVRDILSLRDLKVADGQILLLAQPRMLGHVFNPVSFWLCHDKSGALRVVIAEVTNTFGDRHSYLCHNDDLSPIGRSDILEAEKIFHVSPFQPIEGGYTFRFDFRDDRVGVWIDYSTGNEGLYATLTGTRAPLTSWRILRASFRRPFGSRRVLGLIHWQALKLWIKGAVYRARPKPPSEEVTR
ncbi:MAG: DUF1365 domain-containing protein [Dinoroseobacter sp.]|nr:DUF1365 domain-containing protein [Dinoroseobacter sp.]MDJ0992987.1 DUF1365 domain-containing protein [Dinoroseobacter sp.]